jgi:fibronectin type 3 domain-containing protein
VNRINKLTLPVLVIVLTVAMSFLTTFKAGAYYTFNGSKMITDSGYKYYRAWSQDQYPWHNTKPSDAWESDWMNRYGCSTVAMAKMFVEAGVADPEKVNPGTLMSKYGSPSKGIGDVGIYWSTLAGQFGMTCYSFQQYPTGSFYQTAMNFFNKTNRQYHLLLKVTLASGGTHYVQVDRQATVNAGEIIINDSTNTSDNSTRYNSASAYYKALALKKLSQCTFTPDYFVVFYNNDVTKVKSVKCLEDSTVKVTWYPNGSCEKYNIFRREKGEKSWTGNCIASVKSVSGEGLRSYVDKKAKIGKTYEYTVRGYYNLKNSQTGIGYNTSGTAVTVYPSAPKLTSATSINQNTIRVKWKKVGSLNKYRVYRKKATDTKWTSLASEVKGTYYDDKTAECGTKYYYTVRAYVDDTNKLGYYNKTGIAATALPASVKLTETESLDFNTIKINWQKNSGVTGYGIYRKTEKDKSYSKIGEVKGASQLTFTDLSATTGVNYIYNVRAYKTVNGTKFFGAYNKTGINGVARTQASKITSYSSTQADEITISWEAVNGANGYGVYRKAQGDSSYKKIKTISGNGNTEYTDSGVKCCVKYYYMVKGYRTVSGKKYYGFASPSKVAYSSPEQPGLKSAVSTGYKSIKLQWTAVNGATSYKIYRKTNGKYTNIGEVKGKNTTEYTDSTATTGVKYTYTVRAVSEGNGIIKYSTYENYIYGTAYPSAPTLKATKSVEYNEIAVNWTPVDGATGYHIYRKTEKEKKYTLIAKVTGKNVKVYNDKTATCGVNYYYTVKSFRTEDGKDYYSKCKKGVKGKALPATPTITVKANNYNTLDLSWNKIKGATGYRIYYKLNGDKKWTTLATFANENLTSCSHTKLTTGKKYFYTIRAYTNRGGKDYWGSYSQKNAEGTPYTSAPSVTSVKSSVYNKVTVNWKSVQGASGYRIYRKADGDKKWSVLTTLKGKSTVKYTDKTAVCGTKYSYTVRAYRTVSKVKKFGYFNKTGLSVRPIPDKTTVTLKSENYNKIKVSWLKSGGAKGYKVYRKVENGTYALVKNITNANTLSFTDTVDCGVEYYYYVTSYVTVNKVEYGGFDSGVVKCKAVPLTPTLNSAVSKSTKSVTVSWNGVSGASGYYVYRKDTVNNTYKIIDDELSATSKSFTDTTVESGVKYTYTVKAYRICNAGYISGGYNSTGVSVVAK